MSRDNQGAQALFDHLSNQDSVSKSAKLKIFFKFFKRKKIRQKHAAKKIRQKAFKDSFKRALLILLQRL
jgi:hypothetical protein